MPDHVKEAQFETDIVEWLIAAGGYSAGTDSHYDKKTGLDTAELFAFIGATQAKKWEQLIARHGGDPNKAQQKFVSRLVAALDKHGTVDVLRKGFDDQGLLFTLCYFKPASGMNATLADLYVKNRLTVTRQLHYSTQNNNSLDVCLFVNGIPVATAELKNPLNGQTVDHAITQYKNDRDPADVLLGQRALVHFAVDPHLAYMTTRLAKNATEFLPFNQGNDPGRLSCGEGNPPNPGGYATAYLKEGIKRCRVLAFSRDDIDAARDAMAVFQRLPGAIILKEKDLGDDAVHFTFAIGNGGPGAEGKAEGVAVRKGRIVLAIIDEELALGDPSKKDAYPRYTKEEKIAKLRALLATRNGPPAPPPSPSESPSPSPNPSPSPGPGPG